MGAARPPGPLRPAGVVGAHLCVRPLAGAPRGRGPARPGHRFCCQKRWENHQGLRFLRWLRVDFHRRRPRRLRPWTQGPMGGIVGTSYGSLASPQAAKLVPSTVPPLPTEPASLGFGGGPVFAYVTGAAAPRVARIVITPQALTAAALYRLGPPGRHRCHAAEIPWRLW